MIPLMTFVQILILLLVFNYACWLYCITYSIIIIIINKSDDKTKRKNSEVLRSIRTTRKYLDFLDVLLTTLVQDECTHMYETLYVYTLEYLFLG